MDFVKSASRIVKPINHIDDGYTDAQRGIDTSVEKTLEASTAAAIGVGTSVTTAAGIFIFVTAGQAVFTLLKTIVLLVGGLLLMLLTPLMPILSIVFFFVAIAGLGFAIFLPFWIVVSLFPLMIDETFENLC
jgi:hypothetical protein